MTFNEYQHATEATVEYPRDKAVEYCALGLAGESGEVANLIKKELRGDLAETHAKVLGELGDVLWYLARLSAERGYSFEQVAAWNLAKIADRKLRDVIKGTGDNR